MEENPSSLHSSVNVSQVNPESSLPGKKKYFRNYLKSEAGRFSSLIISNSVNIEEKKLYFKIFMLSLQRPPSERDEEDQIATCKVLMQENIFPEFKNDINVLGMFAKSVMVRHYQINEPIICQNCKDENLYKILKGQVLIKRKGQAIVKQKGQFLQTYEDYQVVKGYEAGSQIQSYLLVLPYKLYGQAMKMYLEGKTILKMMTKTSLFASFKRRELAYIFQRSQIRLYTSKELVFEENQKADQFIYFLIEGEIAISKHVYGGCKGVNVCRLTDGTVFGEEIIFQRQLRGYTVCVCSSSARILVIDSCLFNDLLVNKENRMDQIKKSVMYRRFIKNRQDHYEMTANFSNHLKDTLQTSKIIGKMSATRKKKMNKMIGGIQKINNKITDLQRIFQKRQNFSTPVYQISVRSPLFRRQDFPLMNQQLKRYELVQKRARQIYLTLPAI